MILGAALLAAAAPTPPVVVRTENLIISGHLRLPLEELDRAADFLGKGEPDEALAIVDPMIAAFPGWSAPLTVRAMAVALKGEDAEALSLARRALQMDPDYFYAHFSLGFIHLQAGRAEDALSPFDRALQLAPAFSLASYHRALVYTMLGRIADARRDLEAVVAADPQHSKARWLLARVQVALDDMDGAIANAVALTRQHPEDPFLAGYQADLLTREGRKAEAAPVFDRAIALAKADADPAAADLRFRRLVTLLAMRGDVPSAMAMIDDRISADPRDALALAERCHLSAAENIDPTGAIRDCDAALGIDPGQSRAVHGKALALLRLERWDDAADSYRALVAKDPNDSLALHGLGIAKARMGDAAGSAADLRAARRIGFDVAVEFESYGITP